MDQQLRFACFAEYEISFGGDRGCFYICGSTGDESSQNYGPGLWNFLNQPLIVALLVGAGVGALSGAVTAWTTASIASSKCSDTASDDAEIIKRIIDELSSTQKHRAISVSIRVGNVIANLTMEAIPNGQDVGDGCTPPPRKLIAKHTPSSI